MEWFAVVLVYTILCKVYFFLGRSSENKLIRVCSKCSPLVFLSLYVAKELTAAHMVNRELSTLIWGQVFCCLGDAYLVYESFFPLGVLSFAVGQLVYFFLFGGSLSLFLEADGREIAAGAAIGCLSLAIFLYLVSKIPTSLKALAFGYCVLISLMVWSAFVRFHSQPQETTALGLCGAALFYTSDVLLSINRWRITLPYGDMFVMTTYYTAQLFIAGSFLMNK